MRSTEDSDGSTLMEGGAHRTMTTTPATATSAAVVANPSTQRSDGITLMNSTQRY